MIPSALAGQLEQGLADFLRFSFWSRTPGMEDVLEEVLGPGGLVKGPYVSVKLPFVRGKDAEYFPDVPLGWRAHRHQEQAFERLGGRRKLSTLVATGTGSGKTESFLLPILDHCRTEAATPGVKAILVYPMNALANDQAGRIARRIHGNDKLRGRIRAGLYIGDSGQAPDGAKPGGSHKMGEGTVITDRSVLRESPPDVLLTNYKMLDYLLLRPEDQGIWQHNVRGVLRFLVVDEIHTFDGAQGTDLACLIRRLKRRLQVDDGSLCCVGTSATLGGLAAAAELRAYATDVFGELFDDHSVIGESRLSDAEYLKESEVEWTAEPGEDAREALEATRATDPDAWLAEQERLWFGEALERSDGWRVELGRRLRGHGTFHALLKALGGRTVELRELADRLARQRGAWREDPRRAHLAVLSLLGLISAARSSEELPFLDVRLQLWQRELTRMVAPLSSSPRLRHWHDLDKEARETHLPLVHCRECGAMGWATLVERDRPYLLRTALDKFYRAFFADDPRIQFLYPRAAVESVDSASEGTWLPRDPTWHHEPFWVDMETLTRVDPETAPDFVPGKTAVELVRAPAQRSTPKGAKLSRDCPFCKSRESQTLIGFRAATLTSVYIDQLFASAFNDDKKLLTFSDSVQDAAHRAGFFGARTWRTNLRVAMLRAIREGMTAGPLTLATLAKTLGETWKDKMDRAAWVSTFLAPNMDWLRDWETLRTSGSLPRGSNLEELISRRLAYEVCTEFGLQAGIGRSLPRTGTATVALDEERLERAVELLFEPLCNEVGGLRQIRRIDVRRFVVGLLHYLRNRGGILSWSLPVTYVESSGVDTHSFYRAKALPVYRATSRLPTFLTDGSHSPRFETWGGKGDDSWLSRWVPTSFVAAGQALTADSASVYPLVLPLLVKAGLLQEVTGKKGERIWGIPEDALVVSTRVIPVVCDRCGQRMQVAEHERDTWLGMPCLSARCQGITTDDSIRLQDYFGRLYGSGDLERIFTAEHTGLLDRGERERVETEFKARAGEGRRPWYVNLLSCTPTLEMGIDIGDLSAAVLCSVPPGQASYLQRIGRAGRQDGNAFVLTVAASKPHDLYFFAEPQEMMEGEVPPPGVFVDAPAVLERQLTAFCVDRWVASHAQQVAGGRVDLPRQLRSIFSHLDEEGSKHFPFNFMQFVKDAQPTLLREFCEMFSGAIREETAGHLERFLVGTDEGKAGMRWRLLDALRREQKQRDSLSGQARSLREQVKQLKEKEAKGLNDEEEIGKREREKDALLALVAAINRRPTLEFLTDEGLLPNYAFPEAAVRLSSVIWREKGGKGKGSSYETLHYEYKRSPSSALSELAPRADFYAGGRQVKIDQVDVAVSELETWRFCIDCNHAEPIDAGDASTSCPACRSATWCDEGQKFRLLKLQQVFANSRDRDSRIRDDSDERRPAFFQRQMLIDVQDEDRAGAWRIDDAKVPFGFEFLKRATFRDVNFGEVMDQGKKSTIAGKESVRPGFAICARCGKVQVPNKDPVHALSCPSKKEGGKPRMESCLYLYREFSSEALRLLLPMADLKTVRRLSSFVAALRLGLEEYFSGSVEHLQATVYSDPVEGSALRKEYLVVYDAVPGGTGYLKQLVTPGAGTGEMPIFKVLELALERVESCVCWNDPERSGCYRCLYAYRNSREMEDMSSQVASEILRDILGVRDKVTPVGSLGEVSISGLTDSVLEARFLECLRRIEDKEGRAAKLKDRIVNQKPGYHWTLGDAEWVVEPQVNPPVSETGGVPVSIDFVLRPASARTSRRLAVFLDGWAYHKDRIGQDLRQRMAMLSSGNWDVWSFTWADLDEKLSADRKQEVLELAVPHPAKLKSLLQKMELADHVGLPGSPVFSWFERELLGEELRWRELATAILAGRMQPALATDADRWRRFVERLAPPAARKRLAELVPKLFSQDAAEISPFFELTAVHDGNEPALLCALDDRAENLDAPGLQSAWQGYLRLFQLLRRLPNAWFMTYQGVTQGDKYDPIAALVYGGVEDMPWFAASEIEEPYRTLARALMAAGVPEPEVGLDVPDRHGGTWTEAEMVWEEARVALTSREDAADALGEPASGWVVLYLEEVEDDPQAVLRALQANEET